MKELEVSTMCRFCLKTQMMMLLELTESQREIFSELTRKSLVINENLPTNICTECSDKLESFNFYRLQLIRKQNELSMYLNYSSIEDKNHPETLDSKTPEQSDQDPQIDENFEITEEASTALQDSDENKVALESQESSDDFEILEEVYSVASDDYQTEEDFLVEENYEEEIHVSDENQTEELNENVEQAAETRVIAFELPNRKRSTKQEFEQLPKAPRNEEIKYRSIEPSFVLSPSDLKITQVSSRDELGETFYICNLDDCKEEFSDEKQLKAHLKNHVTIEQLNVCQVCGQVFENRTKLRSHMRNHDRSLKHRCSFEGCHKVFRVKHHLNNHIRTHTQESPFVCSFEGCTARFRQKHALTIHIRKHTGEFFKCEACHSPFVTQFLLNKHLEKCTGTYRPLVTRATPRSRNELPNFIYKCSVESCEESFRAKISLTKHLQKVHEIEVTRSMCVLCCVTFENPQQMKAHLREHLPYSCNLCGVCFKTEENYNLHQAKSHDQNEVRTHQCPKCPAAFKRAEHLRTHYAYKHKDEQPYTCDRCPFTTTIRADVTSHMKIHTMSRKFESEVCEILGKTESNLKNDMSTEKNYFCVNCSSGFESKMEFSDHQKECVE